MNTDKKPEAVSTAKKLAGLFSFLLTAILLQYAFGFCGMAGILLVAQSIRECIEQNSPIRVNPCSSVVKEVPL